MERPDPRLFSEAQAMKNFQPRVQAAVAEGAFLAVQEAKASGADDTMQAAILAGYARAWESLTGFIDARIREDGQESHTKP